MPQGKYQDKQLILNLPTTYSPHDSNNITVDHKGMQFSTDGNIVFVPWNPDGTDTDGTAVTIAVKAGVLYPFKARRLNATNHTAGNVVLWRY
jgi:hypothetical protein